MSTNSVIAMSVDGPPAGRYVHWDGYPTGVGLALHAIVARDGLQLAARTLLSDWTGWSTLTGDSDVPDDREPLRFTPVPGYGLAYTRAEQPDEWIPLAEAERCGAEWAYVLAPDHLDVYRVDVGPPVMVGQVAWASPADEARAELEAIDTRARAGVAVDG